MGYGEKSGVGNFITTLMACIMVAVLLQLGFRQTSEYDKTSLINQEINFYVNDGTNYSEMARGTRHCIAYPRKDINAADLTVVSANGQDETFTISLEDASIELLAPSKGVNAQTILIKTNKAFDESPNFFAENFKSCSIRILPEQAKVLLGDGD